MSKVKSYLISLGDYVLPVGKNYEFSYKVQVPSGVKYNEVSYSDHAVYYCLDTDQGKLKTQTEPNKLGIRIAEKYDLEITKTEINSDRRVSQTVFVAQDEESNSITATTNKEGIATIKNLYAEKEYVIKEIKANNNYIRNDEEIRIIGHVVDGQLQIEILEGKFKDAPVIEVVENNNTKVKVGLEDEVKYNFELNKTQTVTNEAIQGIRFELRNENTGDTKRYTTNEEGKLTIKLLEPNIQYTLTEIESQGHYLKEPVSFMMVRGTDRNLKFNVLSGDLDTLPQIDTSGEVPVVRTGLANEKIPTYSLRVTKKETDADTTIAGAQFKLIGENKEDNILYTTDENGVVQIDNLYQFVEGKNVTGVYTLQEIFPTEGYILNEIPVEFRAQKDATGNLKLEIISGTIRENVDEIQVDNTNPDNPVISITIDNEPVFTLTKIDAQTKEPLEGVGFEVTNLDGNPVKDANGKYVGLQELAQIDLLSTGNYQWTQNEDGTWQSGNQGISYTTSTLTSESFTIEEDALLSFDWSVSSNTSNYLYVTVTNLDNNTTIGGNKNNYRISGTTRGTEYESLIYDTKEIELTPGTYKVEFKYYRGNSTISGLDTGYVKNVKVISKDKTVKTDKDGKIRLSLVEGLYKATETKPLEGYATPELYTGIGIGESKEAKYDLRVEWENIEKRYCGYQGITTVPNGVIAIVGDDESSRNSVVKYDLDGNVVWESVEKDYSYKGVTTVEDGVIAVAYYGVVVKYDLDGNVIWENAEKNDYKYTEITTVEDGVIAVSLRGEVVKYDLEGNIVWENTEKKNYGYYGITTVEDGIIAVGEKGEVVKYDLEGKVVWQNIEKNYNYHGVTTVENGIIAVGYGGEVAKYDLEGNIAWENTEKRYTYKGVTAVEDGIIAVGYDSHGGGVIVKYDLEGKVVWQNTEEDYSYDGIAAVEDGIIVISVSGIVEKYDLEGNIAWENTEKRYTYKGVTAVEDGIIAVGYDSHGGGVIVKYDLEGKVVWQNTEEDYSYDGIAAVEDGIIVISVSGIVEKYDLEGNIVWKNAEKDYDYREVATVENGIIAVGYGGEVAKYDLEGNFIWENLEKSYSYTGVTTVEDGIIAVGEEGEVVKYDLEGNVVWENIEKNYSYKGVTTVENGIIAVGYGDDYGRIVKYDLEGNLVWENKEVFRIIYNGIAPLKDGVIIIGEYIGYAGGSNGIVVKCDLNGNIEWENLEKRYEYNGIVALKDGIIAAGEDGVVKYQNHIIEPEIQNATNVTVENELQKYKITTKVDGFGGNISGKNEQPYEEVIYLHDSTKDIIATPSEGYKVQSITINGNPIDFIENSDGTVKLDKFYQMTEDKEIIVSFVKVDSSLIIEKIDSTTLTGLSNAIFNIQTVETRDDPTITDIVGSIVANGQEYVDSTTTLEDEVIDFEFGSLTNNGTYYFVEENGKYVSNNNGVNSTTANSYIQIDLKNYEGSYALVVNANVSSESNYDYGYATITENTTAPSYSSSNGRFIYITGTSSSVTAPTDYSVILEGGKIYYLHLGYRKDGSGNSGEDKFTVNSIKLYNAIVSTITNTYNFVDNGNGGYESNNQGQANTTANSYIPIDLTNYTGKYNLIVNANVSSASGDYGYATVTTTTTAPTYNNSTGRFIYISGTSSSVTNPKDYTTVLEGGKMYYLHLGYYKNGSSDSGEDKFTVNSINITLNQDDFVNEDYVTNANGEAIINDLPEGRYKITEVQAPEGYTLNPEPIVYDMVVGQENKITVENDPQVDLIVHHYIKDTTTSVAPDEYIKGDLGKEYSTSPKTDLEEYELVKNEDGSYQIPENASGVFTEETQVVTYYYEKKPLQLIVHHYIDGTEDSVAPDEESRGGKGR